MISRYANSQMTKIWSDDNRFKKWLKIELAVCEAQAELGNIPQETYDEIAKKAAFKLTAIRKAEEKNKHELVAFLNVIQKNIGDDASRWVHYGLTSSDVMDTALAIQIKDASSIIKKDIDDFMSTIKSLANKHRYVPIIGRTHGVHAEPTTLGLKFAAWFDEMKRNKENFEYAVENALIGKISGAVGNFANIDPKVGEKVMKKLGLKHEPAPTQIVHRDRYARLIASMAIMAATIEKIATEIRNLQRTEIGEMEEPFAASQQGSSAMPHKRNPVQCEQLCGLSRLMRSYTIPAIENMVLWHERDISHSSVERVIIPDSFTLADYMLKKITYILSGIVIHPDKMMKNIEMSKGLIFSQRLLLKLIRSGVPRAKAHLMIQGKVMSTYRKGDNFMKQIVKDGEIRRYISLEEIQALFDLDVYIRYVDYIFKKVFTKKKK
ncbi:adenylosuccinate lyase [bacterium]|nr:adenylosuccinate lyase [bacterium]